MSVDIKGTNNSTLTIGQPEKDYIVIELRTSSGRMKVRSFLHSDASTLAKYFSSLVISPDIWSGTKDWQSVEGDVIFKASNDGLGHTTIQTMLIASTGEDDCSKFESNIIVDFTTLQNASRLLSNLFKLP